MSPKAGTIIQGEAHSAPLPPRVKLDPKWGRNFSPTVGFSMPLRGDNLPLVFLDKRLLSASDVQLRKLTSRPFIAGHVITCEKKEWVIQCEPTGEKEIGFIAYTEKGKAILSGTLTLTGKGSWKVDFKTLYPRISNKKKHSVSGEGGCDSEGKCSAKVVYKIEF